MKKTETYLQLVRVLAYDVLNRQIDRLIRNHKQNKPGAPPAVYADLETFIVGKYVEAVSTSIEEFMLEFNFHKKNPVGTAHAIASSLNSKNNELQNSREKEEEKYLSQNFTELKVRNVFNPAS